ncbi:MAG: succinyl-diaminopimelate desuccinylase [Rickettsiaceae bacterium]|nr:succinyl-diaminopimelate desuccinylase [Rickettsiaceae bacterium]
MIDSLDLLKKLISFRSVTPQDDGSIDHIASILKNYGFTVYIKTFGPNNVKNLYAHSHKAEGFKSILLAGHIDVVEPGDGWNSDPFQALEKDGKIYGRGAVDMKGALSCMIAAGVNLVTSGDLVPNSAVCFLITSDEEGEAEFGTKAMVEWMDKNGHLSDFAIVGEPTCASKFGDSIKIGRRGSANFELRIHGMQGHVAYPNLADNPNSTIIKVLKSLIDLQLDNGDEIFEPSNLEITSIDVGNNSTNIIPSMASAKFNIRFNKNHNEQSLLDLLRKTIELCTNSYELEYKISAMPFLSKPSSFTEILRSVIYEQTNVPCAYSASGGTSDARFLHSYIEVAEFGLLSGLAHKINEYTQISHLQRLYNVYYHALNRIFGYMNL